MLTTAKNGLVLRSALVAMMILMAIPVLGPAEVTPSNVAQAQGPNLLQNTNFSNGFYGREGIDGQIPLNWDLWADGQPPATDYNQFLPYARSAPGSWILKGGYVAWTGGGFQTVTVEPGKTYRFTIYGFLWTCDDREFSCTGPDGRSSDTSFGARAKVGIDPTGGTDGLASTVLWSTPQEAYDAFYALTVDAVAESTQMTVFFYTTVAAAPALRETYWDDASLVALPEGEGNPLNAGAAPEGEDPLPEPPQTVPFVSPQSAQPDGSVVHVVAEGDTFDSILVAYRYLGVTRDDLLERNGWEEPPRWIFMGDRITILPAGSVNPETGEVISNPSDRPGTGTGTGTDEDESTEDPSDESESDEASDESDSEQEGDEPAAPTVEIDDSDIVKGG